MDSKAMFKLTYGLYVLTAEENGKNNGCIVNTASQVTSNPNKISVTVNKTNYTHDMIERTGKFAVSVISEDADFELFKRFGFQSGRNVDKFMDFADYEKNADGLCYITKGTNSYIAAKVTDMVDAGTHTIFIGEVTDMEIIGKYPSVTYACT